VHVELINSYDVPFRLCPGDATADVCFRPRADAPRPPWECLLMEARADLSAPATTSPLMTRSGHLISPRFDASEQTSAG
jgi:hypothetical protein